MKSNRRIKIIFNKKTYQKVRHAQKKCLVQSVLTGLELDF